MKVIVTGAARHIGTYLIPMLVNSGYEVTTITQHESKPCFHGFYGFSIETV